jgi:2-(acetamidomethylene)succinate hydrolase
MSDPVERFVDLPAGRFRVLEWPGSEPAAVFLHGLTGVAEVWGPTVEALGPGRPRCIAVDQRGHGHSPKPPAGYGIASYVGDVVDLFRALGLDRPHLVGHSMGARVAIVLAARHAAAIRSVTVVDIGPEQWKANWQQTVAGLDRLPASYPDAESAIGNAARARAGASVDAAPGRPGAETLRGIALARLQTNPDGSVSWLADREALKKTVVSHRSRSYWREWERIGVPALFIRGGDSNEVRPRVAAEMRRRNARVCYEEFPGVGHNIPLLAPARLADSLRAFWATV